MSHGHWIKKTALFFSCTTTMLSFTLVISTAGFCVVRFHLDYSYIDILISRLLNSALLAHQIGNWLGVVTIAVAAATTKVAVKVYALAAVNWLCLSGMCFALIFFTAGEAGSLTSFYWSMTIANLFHKTSHTICLEIAPCGANCTHSVDDNCKADATNYCVASFVASAIITSLMKYAVLALTDESPAWRQLSVHSRPLGQVTVTIHGRRSVKTTVDYRAAKWLYITTILLTALASSAWSVIVYAGINNTSSDQSFNIEWNSKQWETRVVTAILGIVPGAAFAAVAATLCWWVVWEAYTVGRTHAGRGFKWAVIVVGIVVAVKAALVYRQRRPQLYNEQRVWCAELAAIRAIAAAVAAVGTACRAEWTAVQGAVDARSAVMAACNANEKFGTVMTMLQYVRKMKGPQGPPGLRGATGPAGPAGPRGTRGERGEKGARGAAGPRGPRGDKGEKGPRGQSGPRGPKGEPGAQGMRGEAGNAGAGGVEKNVIGTTVEKKLEELKVMLKAVEWDKVVEERKKVRKAKKAWETADRGGDNGQRNLEQKAKKLKEVEARVDEIIDHQMDNVKKAAGALVGAVEQELRKEMKEKEEGMEEKVEKLKGEVMEMKTAHDEAVNTAVAAATDAEMSADDAAASARSAEEKAKLAEDRAEAAKTSAYEAALMSYDAAEFAAEASQSAREARAIAVAADQRADNAETAALASVVASAGAVGIAGTAMVASAGAVRTSNLAMSTASAANDTATQAKTMVKCGIKWMRAKITEIFGIQEMNEGRRWIVMTAWGIVGVCIVLATVGLSDTERDWLAGISEEEVRETCNTAALVGGVLGLAAGFALGAFAKKLGVELGTEKYGRVTGGPNCVKELIPVLGLAAGTAVGLYIGMFLGLIIGTIIYTSKWRTQGVHSLFLGRVTVTVPGRKAKITNLGETKSIDRASMGGGALIGATVGILAGLAYRAATDAHVWPQKWVVAASIRMNIAGLGTVYSIYPRMPQCLIKQFHYSKRTDVITMTLSTLPSIAIICVSEWTVYGPEQQWNTQEKPWMCVWYGAFGLIVAQYICEIIVICVLQHPHSRMSHQVTTSPVRSRILTVTIMTCGQISAAVWYPGVVANSACNSATIMLNNTATLTTMLFTGLLGEGYLTELKKYDPGKWPTQGMGKHKAFNWWCASAFRNSCHIWSCISTTDLRRDIMLCKQ